jgi:lipopolysaccharide transport system permease protein
MHEARVAPEGARSTAAGRQPDDRPLDTDPDDPMHRHVLDLTGEWTPPLQWVRSVWGSRDLINTLARKDFFVRYRRASFGVFWAVALPLVQATVLSFVFSYIRVVKEGAGISLPVYVFTGMCVWTYFSGTVQAAATSIVDGSGLSSRVYFPRAVLPLINVRTNLYSLPINIVIVIALALILGNGLDQHVFLLVPGVAMLIWLTAGLGLTLAALHVYFRDVRYIVTATFTALIYLTPIFLPLSIYKNFKWVVLANPVTGVVEVFRLAVGGADPEWVWGVIFCLAWCVFLTVTSVYLHCRRDRLFVDLL